MFFLNFFKKQKSRRSEDVDSLLIGYMRVKTAELLKLDPKSEEFYEKSDSIALEVEKSFLPHIDVGLFKGTTDIFSSLNLARLEDVLGQYFILVFLRIGIIEGEIAAGRVKREDAHPKVIIAVLNDEILDLVGR